MSTHALFVAAAYAVAGVGIAGLVAWIILDGRAQKRAMRRLEESGVRRRSDGTDRP